MDRKLSQTMHYDTRREIKEIKSFFKFKTLLRFQIWSKNLQTFFRWCKYTRVLFQFFFYQMCQKFVDLFTKNMNGWSDKKNILYLFCSFNLLRKKEKIIFLSEQQFCVQIFPKYFFLYLLIKIFVLFI